MKVVKDYIKKLGFVFKEIFKAGPSVFFLSIGSMAIAGISPVLITYLTAELIEKLGQNIGNDSQTVYVKVIGAFIVMFLLVVISYATESIKTVICAVAGLKLSHNIENLVADKFQSIKQERIDNPEFLDLHSNTLNRCGSEPLNLMESLFGTVANVISLIGYTIIIAKHNIIAFLVIVIFTIPIIVFKRKYQGLTFRFYNERTMQLRRIMYYLELLTEPEYTNEVRGYRLYDYIRDQREELFRDFINGNTKIAAKEITVSLITSLISMIGAILVGVWLIHKTIAGTISVSEFYLLITAIMTLATDLLALSDQIASNSKSMMFINYIFDYMEEPNLIENSDLKITEKSIHDICFENVSFKYTGSDNYVLKNISVSFNTSETVCLVGENGSGKSTFVKLLLRIYDPTEGRILLDGIDLKAYDINEIRKFYGVLFQDYVKFSDSVHNCIGFGNIDNIQNDEGIAEAAKLTGADTFIENYKDGYETNLSKMFFNDAIEPSGGQWQKIAISRAVYSDAQVLVLDEPTAALDPKSEVKMFDTFKNISELKSTIIISHRMYITKLSNKIILLENGNLVEEGSFEELIKVKKEFYSMYKIQSDSYSMSVE
ncbi:ATP-binding cassette domain-containing protein [Lachnospiraceae bacterium WCA-9-b2]|uniref:ATP-binding cassette domain-containing protein n=1 Tax=Sporofaciens musculi TaxID=2681861 RepID=A0A7X3MCU7_9FIRM|nr:ABC transporter ATP-binding protein [Sporofaciens musculi]MXP74073.1 ATP-binding cassette domain-containing protein [Sporofaciens musculi]